MLCSRAPKPPGGTAGVLVLDNHLWSPSGAEVWQLECPAAPALHSAELHWVNKELQWSMPCPLGTPPAHGVLLKLSCPVVSIVSLLFSFLLNKSMCHHFPPSLFL